MSAWAYGLQNKQRRFLVVEDEPDIANLVALYLKDLNGDVTIALSGDQGLSLITEQKWDLIVLDLQLPGIDGIDLCRRLRSDGCYTPVIILTARTTELDRVLGLEIGADDYLTKPFSSLELLARVKALLRRTESQQSEETGTSKSAIQVVKGGFLLNRSTHSAMLNNELLDLTAKEFDLLWFFVSHPGQVFRRTELLEKVWGYLHQGYEHTVNSHINRLRGKVEVDLAHPRYIHTVWGVGYRFDADINVSEDDQVELAN